MFGLVLGALRARRAQSIALFALTVLAALGASAAPWFMGWARDAVAVADIAAAPASQRVVTATGSVRFAAGAPTPTTLLRELVAEQLDIAEAEVVVGGRLYGTMAADAGASTAGLYLNFRDDVCEHLRVEGQCMQALGEVVIGRATADALGLTVGDPVRFEGFRLAEPVTLRVSGVYDVVDLLEAYWAGTDLLSGPVSAVSTIVDDPAFITEQTLAGLGPNGLDVDVHLILPPSAYHGSDADLAATLTEAELDLRPANLELRTSAFALLDQIARDQRLVGLGSGVAAAQLLVLCWFALFLAVRHSAQERRPDIGLLKVRGTRAWRTWVLTAAQSGLPMLAGGVLGWLLGFGAAALLADGPAGLLNPTEADPVRSLGLSLAAAGLACVGALVAALLAEWRALRAPVQDLLRRVPARSRGWRAEVVDLVVVLLAAAGVYQAYTDLRAGGDPSVLALLAPGLVGLAIALLVARALPLAAGRAGGSALRAGRPAIALAALHVARRPGTHRVFAVLAVAVSVLTTGLVFAESATSAWSARAAQELGAARVLTVRAASSVALLHAVRAADPDGRYAMAVARTEGVRTEDRVLAVDTTRLPAVTDLDLPVQRLRPAAPASLRVVDGPLTLDALGPAAPRADAPVGLTLQLATVDGTMITVDFGPLGPTRRTYPAQVSGCGGGCRLVSLALVAPQLIAEAQPATVELYELAQPGGPVVSPPVFGDVARWRPLLGPSGIGNVLAAGGERLAVSLFDGARPPGQRVDARVFAVDAPAPLPVVLAGERPPARRAGDSRISVLGTDYVPYQVVATVAALPRLGANGLLTDLEYAARSVSTSAESAALEVWLTADTPAAVTDRLTELGVRILAEETVTGRRDRLAEQGPGLALRFQLFAAVIALLLAAGMLTVTASVERAARAEELSALRAQGLPARAVAVAAYGGVAPLVGAALLTGVLAALISAAVVTAGLPVFGDDWSLLPVHRGVGLLGLASAIGAAALVLGAAAATGAAQVVATVRPTGSGEAP